MAVVNSKIKRAVAKEWIDFFPGLHLVTPQRLYKILGYLIIGIYLGPNGEWYGAYFVIHPLYAHPAGIDLKSILDGFMVMVRKERARYIPREEKYRIQPKQELKEVLGVFLDGDIILSKFLDYVDELLFPKAHAAGDFIQLHLLKIFTAMYVGDKKTAQGLCDSLTDENTKWTAHKLASYYSDVPNPFYHAASFDEFRNNIQSVIDNPGPMLDTIEANKNDPKLKKLKRSEILAG